MVEERPLDQSDFIVSQTLLQAPPPPIEPAPNAQKKKQVIIAILLTVVVVSTVAMAVLPKRRNIAVTATPTPEPSALAPMNQKQQIISQITQEIKLADPENVLLPPPQVDMNVEF